MINSSVIKDYFSKLNWSNIIFMFLISPFIMSFFWSFIGDPLIGKTSNRIDYGYTPYLPNEYYRVYDQDGLIEIQENILKVWRSNNEELIATCKPESFNVGYVAPSGNSGIKSYFMGLLPKTLYGNFSAHVTCTETFPSDAKDWILSFDNYGCVTVSYNTVINGAARQIAKSTC